MADANFKAAGFAILIENDPIRRLQSRRKTYAQSKSFNPTQPTMSISAKKFSANCFAFSEFGHLIWRSVFPVIDFTDNRSVTRFFQSKIIRPALWNACDYVLQYNFVKTHVASYMNTAAELISRPEVKPTEKLGMNIRRDITTNAIDVNIQCTGVAEEELLHNLTKRSIT